MWRSLPGRKPDPRLLQVVPSAWDEKPLERACMLFRGLGRLRGCSVEIVSEGGRVKFYIRAASETTLAAVRVQLEAAYPQADLLDVPIDERPYLDPAYRGPEEAAESIEMVPVQGSRVPLASKWRDGELPLQSLLSSFARVGPSERLVAQLVLSPAPSGWAGNLRASIEPKTRPAPARSESSGQEVLALLGVFGVGAVILQGYLWYQAGDLLAVAGLAVAGVAALAAGAAVLARVLPGQGPVTADLVAEKTAYPLLAAQLRITAFAPPTVSRSELRDVLEGVSLCYGVLDHPTGNGLRPQRWRGRPGEPAIQAGLFASPMVLNAAELAGIWHLPGEAPGSVPVAMRAARRLLPRESDIQRGCAVGTSRHRGRTVPVNMPPSLLFRHQLVVAKTRRGKSTLLVHMARYLMDLVASDRERTSLVVVDPHQDLAEAVLGAVPLGLEDRVTYLNLADTTRPIGLNILDVGIFPGRDRTAENVVTMMNRLWADHWGPRMEGALRVSVLCLLQANEVRPRDDQYTLLDVVPMLENPDFREEVLKEVPDPALWAWWAANYEHVTRTLQMQTANPVTTKAGRYQLNLASRLVVGQARSTVDPRALLQDGGVLVVNSAVGLLGEGTAGLMGATVLNLIGLLIEQQVALPPAQRRRIVTLVDESSTLGAADYERMLSELAKYGASFVLVTQSLAKLEAIERKLRPTVLANIDGLTVFQVSAEDARYLAPELGSDLDVADLTGLDDYECYTRWWSDGRKLPAFSLRISPPPRPDPMRTRAIAEHSRNRFGRPRDQVKAEIELRMSQHGRMRRLPTADAAKEEASEVAETSAVAPTEHTDPMIRLRSPGGTP